MPFRESYDPNGPFVRKANDGGLTVPSLSYTVIRERFIPILAIGGGEIPPAPNVQIIRLEDVCAQDISSHTGLPYDDIAIRLVRNVFDQRMHNRHPATRCSHNHRSDRNLQLPSSLPLSR